MPYDPDLAVRLIKITALQRGVDPDLAVAVAKQESWLNPSAQGDGGRSLGLFQLGERAAIDAGIDPVKRLDVGTNITGGVEYLRQSLARANGQVPLALDYYNKGPNLRAGDKDYVAHVMQWYPASQDVQLHQRYAAVTARLAQLEQKA